MKKTEKDKLRVKRLQNSVKAAVIVSAIGLLYGWATGKPWGLIPMIISFVYLGFYIRANPEE